MLPTQLNISAHWNCRCCLLFVLAFLFCFFSQLRLTIITRFFYWITTEHFDLIISWAQFGTFVLKSFPVLRCGSESIPVVQYEWEYRFYLQHCKKKNQIFLILFLIKFNWNFSKKKTRGGSGEIYLDPKGATDKNCANTSIEK